MRRLIAFVVLTMFLVGAMGCSGGKPTGGGTKIEGLPTGGLKPPPLPPPPPGQK
jgi:hypothetical protein